MGERIPDVCSFDGLPLALWGVVQDGVSETMQCQFCMTVYETSPSSGKIFYSEKAGADIRRYECMR